MNRTITNTFIKIVSFVIAFTCSLLIIAVFLFILWESLPIWQMTNPLAFISGMEWSPVTSPIQLGIAPMFVDTLWVAFGALIIAVPIA